MKTKSSPELDQKVINLYISGKDTYETAAELNCSQTFVMNCLKRHKISRRKTQLYTTKYIANEEFFNKIDTEEKAYYLGFMFADGNNYVKGNKSYEVSIKLQMQDKLILEKFRNLLSPTTPIVIVIDKHLNKEYSLFKINSKILSEQLSKLGCVPCKSLILEFPIIDDKLLNHFIRGYFDGDGSIYNKPIKKSGQVDYGISITSSDKFCLKTKSIVESILNIHFSSKIVCDNKITTTISVGGNNQVEKFLDWLYQDSTIYLDRKYNKYLQFKQYRNERNQISSSKSISEGSKS